MDDKCCEISCLRNGRARQITLSKNKRLTGQELKASSSNGLEMKFSSRIKDR